MAHSLHGLFAVSNNAMLNELTPEAAMELLSQRGFGHLGCVLESGEPYVVPVNYFYHQGSIYCHSLEGLKISALRANPKICVQVEDVKGPFEWTSAIVFGEFEEVTDKAERDEVMKIVLQAFEKLTPAEAVRHGAENSHDVVLFRINVRRITGRAER